MKKILFLLLIFIGGVSFPLKSQASHILDILHNDGRITSFEDLIEYEKTIPKETFENDGTGYGSASNRAIIGEDNRDNVLDVLVSPYRRIVRVQVNFPNAKGQGTGSFISDDTIVTSAHNLYNVDYGGWAQSVSVYIMGINTGYIQAKEFMIPRAWKETNGPIDHDFGFIKVDKLYGEQNGWFGLSQKLSSPITLTGFHGDEPWSMKTETGDILKISSNYISYVLDVVKGSSGSPVYNNSGQILAINGYSGPNSSTGITLTKQHYTVAHYLAFLEEVPISKIEILPNRESLEIGEEKEMKITVTPENATNKAVRWISSDESVVSVDKSGKIKGNKEGNASIKVITSDGKLESNCDITVTSEKTSGIYGTVPWVWEAKSRTLTFLDGEFPPSSSNTNILKAIQNDPRLNEETIKTITFTKKVVGHSNSSYLFGYLPNLETINGLELLDTSQVINMTGMFYGATILTSLDVGNWDTSQVTNMDHMFHNTKSLTNVDVGGWNTTKVTNMISMFQDARSLISLDIGGWNTKQVTNMQSMFDNARSLTNLEVGNWDTSQVKSMCNLFSSNYSLTNLDVGSWDTSKVDSMSGMFLDNYSLTKLDVGNWDTSQVYTMSMMFSGARSLTNLNVKNWNTSKVILMGWMFAGASNLTSLDIRSWETLKVTDMSLMFNATVKLDTIHLGSNFKFLKNNYLPEKKGTPYTGKWVNKENSSIVMESSNDFAARYDGTQPGTYIREELKE